MIGETLEIVRKEVNDYIAKRLNDLSLTNRVMLTSFVDESGKVAIPEDTVGLSLLNIEEEKTFKSNSVLATSRASDSTSFVSPPVSINLQIMFTCNFNTYQESLTHLSYILSCLQTKPVFDKNNTPAMTTLKTDRLMFELNTLPLEQQHYIWSMIGLRYLPSVVFRVRMLVVFERDVISEVQNIKEIDTVTTLKEVDD